MLMVGGLDTGKQEYGDLMYVYANVHTHKHTHTHTHTHTNKLYSAKHY